MGCCNKVLQTGGLNQQTLFLTVLEAISPRSKYEQGWFLPRLLSWFSDGHLLPVSSQDLSSVCVCPTCSSFKDTSQTGLGIITLG